MKSKRLLTFFSIQLFFLMQLFNVPAKGYSNDLPKEIFKHWIHSYEEDASDVKVFRPRDYNFPPARGRLGFEIKENGEFIQYGVGPADRSEKTYGHWKAEKKNQIYVYFEDEKVSSYTMEIVSCTKDVLKIKK